MAARISPPRLRPRQHLGKYRIDARLAQGGFADVYKAYDTVEGVRVALKIPQARLVAQYGLDGFKQEVRLTARLDHPNILPIKNADHIDGQFVIAYPLGERNFAERLTTRISYRTGLDYAEQILEAVSHAHEKRIIHCDIKPENLILFDDDQWIRLADFGIARFGVRTMMNGSGSGTVGYLAPEQALGKLSFRSDVFSTGLVLYRMFSGSLPEWPFEWPTPGHGALKRKLHPDMIAFLRRALQVNARRRFENGTAMAAAFARIKGKALAHDSRRRRRKTRARPVDWKAVRFRAFQRKYGRRLETRFHCHACEGPVSEAMVSCPWCGVKQQGDPERTTFPATCPRCRRGVKLDWTYCPWCYGAGVGPLSDREYSDRRYDGRCQNPRCDRKDLMPWMRYCPWCHRKVQRKWKLEGSTKRCRRCGWGVAGDFWEHCPWCAATLDR